MNDTRVLFNIGIQGIHQIPLDMYLPSYDGFLIQLSLNIAFLSLTTLSVLLKINNIL